MFNGMVWHIGHSGMKWTNIAYGSATVWPACCPHHLHHVEGSGPTQPETVTYRSRYYKVLTAIVERDSYKYIMGINSYKIKPSKPWTLCTRLQSWGLFHRSLGSNPLGKVTRLGIWNSFGRQHALKVEESTCSSTSWRVGTEFHKSTWYPTSSRCRLCDPPSSYFLGDPHRHVPCCMALIWLPLHTRNKTSILGSPQQVHWTLHHKQKRTLGQPGLWARGRCAMMLGYTQAMGSGYFEIIGYFQFGPINWKWNLVLAIGPCFEALAGTAAVGTWETTTS